MDLIIALIFLFFLTIAIFFKFFISKYSLLISGMLLSICGIFLFTILYLSKLGKYYSISSFIFKYDYHMFLKIRRIPITYYQIAHFFNVFFAVYFITMLFFVFLYFKINFTQNRIWKSGLTFGSLHLLFTIFFYSPSISLSLYSALYNADRHFFYLLASLVYSIDTINYLLLLLYTALPFILTVKYYKHTFSVYKRKQIVGVTVCLTLSNILCFFLLFFTTLRRPYMFSGSLQASLISVRFLYHSYTAFLLFLIFFLFDVTTFVIIVWHYKIGGVPDILYIRKFNWNKKYIDSNVINSFHTFKNMLFVYRINIQKALAADPEETKTILNDLDLQMAQFIEGLTAAMNLNNHVDLEFNAFDLIKLLDSCTEHIRSNKPIRFERDYQEEKIEIVADRFYLTDVLNNIIQNSIDAIDAAAVGEGKITLTVLREYEWIVIQISDNGIGLTSQELKHLFKPLYTTKNSPDNWGIGLSAVKKMIKLHRGEVYVQSVKGKGTDFTIMLPQNLQC